MEKIFLAFWWRKDENKNIDKIIEKDNIILLNLEKFTEKELSIYLIKENISLPYDHINSQIKFDEKVNNSWWIICNINEPNNYIQLLFLLELYFNTFLNPIFKLDRLWYSKLKYNDSETYNDWFLNQIDIGKLNIFIDSYKWIIDYSYWYRDRVFKWVKDKNKEDFRFYITLWLYQDLVNHSCLKSVHYWEKEVMEMWIILETLFTNSNEKEWIWYLLKKRIHFLCLDSFEDIEKKIKEIYNTRSNFVHWSFYEKVIKEYEIIKDWDWKEDIKEKINNDMFIKTREYIIILRKIILLYYKLFEDINKWKFNVYFVVWKKISCIDVIELSMFNEDVKKMLNSNIKELKEVLPY